MTQPRAIHAVMALLFALHTSGLGEGAILCVSPDGHVSLEAKGAPCCGPQGEEEMSPGAAVAVIPGSTANLAGCGNCTDIPLAGAERSASTPVETKPFAPGSPAVLPAAPAFSDAIAGCGDRVAPEEPTCGRGPWSHIRSVILRR
jgi:hypothetical protein